MNDAGEYTRHFVPIAFWAMGMESWYKYVGSLKGSDRRLTDGHGTYVMTRRILRDNSSIPNLYAELEHWLGTERLIIIDEQPGDLLGRINHLKFVSP